jgi:hypothetical protein
MKIGVTGCSHSAKFWGNPWHYYMGLRLNAQIIESSSPGAGNEMNFEKVKYILDTNPDLDLFVFQITEPGRLVLGLDNVENVTTNKPPNLDTNNGTEFNGSYYYTINPYENNSNLMKFTKKNIDVDEFFINHTFTSDYNLMFKVFHTILGIQQLCDLYNKKIIFFSWMVDLYELAKSAGYSKIIENLNILHGFVDEFAINNNINRIPNDGHYDSISSEKIYDGYIHKGILKFL